MTIFKSIPTTIRRNYLLFLHSSIKVLEHEIHEHSTQQNLVWSETRTRDSIRFMQSQLTIKTLQLNNVLKDKRNMDLYLQLKLTGELDEK